MTIYEEVRQALNAGDKALQIAERVGSERQAALATAHYARVRALLAIAEAPAMDELTADRWSRD